MTPTVAGLLDRARSSDWQDRAEAGRALAPLVDDVAEVRAVVVDLLLDPEDTAVSDSTSRTLLDHGSPVAWRLFAQAWARAQPDLLDHLHATFVGVRATAAMAGDPTEETLRARLTALAEDADPSVRSAVRGLLGDPTR
ncbi:hypothetical protein [Cellulomonas septica]|uniref:HEAT repeat domain-containing protein n=1 Tax=Cellulomonas septica TaxID=285080 RepID=A0ABX1K3L2_9CELL|nr:hypothetical protein [Cellulomonas septica]NKY41159.1 hypothetical protein [Cellulomonas septica]